MRALALGIWVFINLIFFGMCGYMYLLWSQYWIKSDKFSGTTSVSYDQQIYEYNRGFIPGYTTSKTSKTVLPTETKIRVRHAINDENTTLIKNSRPRFPNLQSKDFVIDNKKYACVKNDSNEICDKKTEHYKDNIIKELRRVFTDESNILKVGLENPYDVNFQGQRGNFMNKDSKKLLCDLKRVNIKTVKRSDIESHPLRDYIPKRNLFENKRFNSCAIVASSGALKDSKLGALIDSHDLVLRFNHAPTRGFENDVGSKTTIRILNSQVVTKSQFKFLQSNLYKNITLIAWDPSNYTAGIEQWLKYPDFNLFPNYMEFRKRNLKSRFFLMNPKSLWDIWDFMQENSPSRLRKNPPSSGFLGLDILLPFCNFVDIFEYIPSVRVTKRCHYYDPEENAACTFGVWHPLAAEKLLTYHLNVASDFQVFQTGFVRVPGFRNLNCDI